MRIGALELDEPTPELRNPHALVSLRPWLDAGHVGREVMTRLERHLNATDLGRLARPARFYDHSRYRPRAVRVGYERRITIPNTTVLYARREQPPDFIFLHLLEPHLFAEEFLESVNGLLSQFHVERYVQLGSVADSVPHTRPLLVSGDVPGEEGERLGLTPSTYQGPTSITYALIQDSRMGEIETGTLLVHLPLYTQLDEDYSGVARLMQVLCELYGLPSQLVDTERGQGQYRRVDAAVARNPQARTLVQQLETNYDRRAADAVRDATSPLSPDVERFLREMDKRFGED